MITLETLKNSDIVRNRGTILKVLMSPKVLVLIGMLFFIIFSIGGDTVLNPNLTKIKAQDEMIKSSRQQLDEKQLERKRVQDLQNELKNLITELVPVASGNSPTVVAVSESAEILKIAKGLLEAPETKLAEKQTDKTALPKPHNTREYFSLTPTGSETIDITKAMEATAAPGTTPSSPSPAAGAPNNSSSGTAAATTKTQNAYQFNYELKATGTYAALIDLINELTLRKHLVKFNKITIVPSVMAHQSVPDATEDPDFPVKLDMVAVISIYLYDASASTMPQ